MIKQFIKFFEKDEVPPEVMKYILERFSRQPSYIKKAIMHLIETAKEKDDLVEEKRAIFCLMGIFEEVKILGAISEGHFDENLVSYNTGLPKMKVRNIISRLLKQGLIK